MRFDIEAELAAHQRRKRGEPDPVPAAPSSPIEELLIAALRSARDIERRSGRGSLLGQPTCECTCDGGLQLDGMVLRYDQGFPVDDIRYEIYICRQVAIGPYFADFLIWTPGFALAVECDGHDFHDRTKQQAAYDRARDRELLRLGVPVIRFTGSEIHHDANRCARELAETWRSLVARWRRD